MCGGDHYRNARIAAEEGTAIIEEPILEQSIEERKLKKIAEIKERFFEAVHNDPSHTRRLSEN